MAEAAPTVRIEDVDALVTGATPQFAMQIRARVRALVSGLPEGSAVRAYGEEQMRVLEALSHGTTRGLAGNGRPAADASGWRAIPSHPHGTPLPGADPASSHH